ncbi:MAG: metallophosphoesterase [Halobacteriovoraceae bacterium]|nr:metallophosphoesterase [Halobacteriovoraceae bacterium]
MKIMTISDCHISYEKGDTYNLLMTKLTEGLTLELDFLIFLGDVFDLLIGSYDEYLKIFSEFFELISTLSARTQIVFIEGNHDVHFEGLLKKMSSSNQIILRKDSFWIKDKNKILFFCHGDLIVENDLLYVSWRRFLSSRFMKYMLEIFFVFKDVERIGGRMSQNSRNRNKDRYSDRIDHKVQEKYRTKLMDFAKENGIDYLFAGHSHIKENFEYNNSFYLNNGLFPREKVVIFYDDGSISYK